MLSVPTPFAEDEVANLDIGRHKQAIDLIPYDEAMIWRSEMRVDFLQFSGDVELCGGDHPTHGSMIVITGATSDVPVFVLRPSYLQT